MRYFRYRLIAIALAVVLGLTRASMRRHRTEHAEEITAAQTQASGDSEPDFVAMAMAAIKANDYDRAVTCLDQALQLHPEEPALYISRGMALNNKKQYGRAVKDFTEAIRLDPKNGDAYLGRGQSYTGQKDYDRAVKDLTEAIRLDPTKVDYHVQRGDAYAAGKDFDRAVADHTLAIRLEPKNSAGYTARGSDYEEMKDYEHAIADYSQAVRLNTHDTEAYNSLAWLWSTCPTDSLRNGKLAVEYALYACQVTEWKEGNYLDTLAATYAEVGQFDEAVRWQKKVLDSPDSYEDKEHLDRARHRLKLYQEHKPFRSE